MRSPRVLTRVALFLYGSVLLAGVYAAAVGISPTAPRQLAAFVAVCASLVVLELLGRRVSRRTAALLLVIRIVLFVAAAALDGSGNARLLLVLAPFHAYLEFGRRIGLWLALGCAIGVLALVASTPGWYRDQESISDLLMFTVGLVFAVAMAAAAARAEAQREKAEGLLADLTVAHSQLRSYADEAASLATVAERTRLARDIHDGLGHHLTVIAIQLEKSARYRELDRGLADQALADARDSTGLALEGVRKSVQALRTRDGAFDLEPALRTLTARVGDEDFVVTLEVLGSSTGLGERALMALYHAAQEGLTNARRHARAGQVRVSVALSADGGRIAIQDDGQGFVPAAASRGYGLTGLRERLELIGGELDIASGPGGTRLTASVGSLEPVPQR